MGNKLSTTSSTEAPSNSTSSNATIPLSETAGNSSATTLDASAANSTDVHTSVSSSISTSVVVVTTMSSSSASAGRTTVSSVNAADSNPTSQATRASSEPAAPVVVSSTDTTPSTAVTSKVTPIDTTPVPPRTQTTVASQSSSPVASPPPAPKTIQPASPKPSPSPTNNQQPTIVSNDPSPASVTAHSFPESVNAGGSDTSLTHTPTAVTTSVASTPISITISTNGHKIVTAPPSITTTVASVTAGSTTFIPVIIANPPVGSLNDQSDFSKPKGFLNNTPAVAAVFTVCGLFAVSLVLVLLIRARRKRAAKRRANASAIYTGNMIQRFDSPAWHGIVEPRMPSFEDIPRPPPIPPRRRPVPSYTFESRGSNSPPPLNLGTAIYLPREYSFRPDMPNPFADPSVHSSAHSSPIRELPLLHRPLKTPSNEGHQQLDDEFRPPSPAPSTPSLYPPTLPAFDDGFSLGPSRVTLHDDLETTSHTSYHENPFLDGPASPPPHAL